MFSKIKTAGKELLRKWFLSNGYIVYNLSDYRARMENALQGLSDRDHVFNTVIDVGASDGRWSAMSMKVFSNCSYLLVEANSVHQASLEQFSVMNTNAQFVLAAAGDTVGNVYFDASDNFIGQASHGFSDDPNNIVLPMTTIDQEIISRKLPGPFLIKLDTHGFEVPILKGAEKTLSNTEAIIVECYNFRLSTECLLFHEMCVHLERYGFRCVDLVDPRHRPFDGSLWQMDLVFVKNSSHEFSHTNFF